MLRRTGFRGVFGFSGLSAIALAAGLPPAARGGTIPATITLGTAGNYAVVSNEVVNSGATVINGGDVGASELIGFPPGTVDSPYKIDNADAAAATNDAVTAYFQAAYLTPATKVTTNLGGQTFGPGVYDVTYSSMLSGTVTLNDEGQTDPLFVFQFGSELATFQNFSVVTENDGNNLGNVNVNSGSPGSNVFWTAGSLAALGASNTFQGHLLSGSEITLGAGTTIIDGSALAASEVVLDDNTIDNALYSPVSTAPLPATFDTPAALLCVVGMARWGRKMVGV